MTKIHVEDLDTLKSLFAEAQTITINNINGQLWNPQLTVEKLNSLASVLNDILIQPFLMVIEEFQFPDRVPVYAPHAHIVIQGDKDVLGPALEIISSILGEADVHSQNVYDYQGLANYFKPRFGYTYEPICLFRRCALLPKEEELDPIEEVIKTDNDCPIPTSRSPIRYKRSRRKLKSRFSFSSFLRSLALSTILLLSSPTYGQFEPNPIHRFQVHERRSGYAQGRAPPHLLHVLSSRCSHLVAQQPALWKALVRQL